MTDALDEPEAFTPTIETDETGKRIYEPDGEVLAAYLDDRSPVSVIRGPLGSGTSTASCMKIYGTAMEQKPWASDGIRRSRWGVVRNTYPELITSTMKTWLYWYPEGPYGKVNRSRPMHQVIKLGDLELEVWFLALDGEEDVQKLRSTEFTGIWFNELEFAQYEIFKEARSRTSRYPPMIEGGPTWYGVLGDMNAPSEDHFVPRMRGEAPWPDEVPEDKRLVWPKEWAHFLQPPALLEIKSADGKKVNGYVTNPKAENLKYLVPGYYLDLVKGADKKWIDSRLLNRITFFVDGDPVWPMADPDLLFSSVSLPYVDGREVIVSLDFGRRPCALIAQEIGGKVQLQREFRMYGVGSTVFAPALKRFLTQHYRGATLRFTGDPKGQDKGQSTERSSYDIFRGFGMPVTPAPVKNNHLETRIEAVSYGLTTNRYLVGLDCTTLRAALLGKYCLKRMEMGEPEPIKDKFSDVADCLQYLALFLGEGRRMVGMEAGKEPRPVRVSGQMRSLRRVS
ncbi:hypothetical protein SAMN05519103_00341 [Rhizobiales bacterium GAS113]|nr:hypothetical protein SAMN05519103_00341 [Rhizobiales bacterium GAS113]